MSRQPAAPSPAEQEMLTEGARAVVAAARGLIEAAEALRPTTREPHLADLLDARERSRGLLARTQRWLRRYEPTRLPRGVLVTLVMEMDAATDRLYDAGSRLPDPACVPDDQRHILSTLGAQGAALEQAMQAASQGIPQRALRAVNAVNALRTEVAGQFLDALGNVVEAARDVAELHRQKAFLDAVMQASAHLDDVAAGLAREL
jgi:hypothetical protein